MVLYQSQVKFAYPLNVVVDEEEKGEGSEDVSEGETVKKLEAPMHGSSGCPEVAFRAPMEDVIDVDDPISDSDRPLVGLINNRSLKRKLARKGPIDDQVTAEIAAKLKKISDSYKPGIKKKGESSSKSKGHVPSVSTPVSGVRKTRSAVKAADENLAAALERSRKGKRKQVVDSVEEEEVEVIETDAIGNEDDEMEDVEETVPKSKKRKVAQRRVTRSYVKAAEKSAKRTRSSKRTVVDESSADESDSDESLAGDDSDSEAEGEEVIHCVHDDILTRKVLKGRVLPDVGEEGMLWLLQKLDVQGWRDTVLQISGRCAKGMVQEFYKNCSIKADRITTSVNDNVITFDTRELGELLGIPFTGYDSYAKKVWPDLTNLPNELEITRKFAENEGKDKPRAVQKSEMHPQHQVLFEFVNKIVMPRQEKRGIASFMDLVLMELLDIEKQINWPKFMIHLIKRVVAGKRKHSLPFGFILTDVFAKLKIPLEGVVKATKKEKFGCATLISCDLPVQADPPQAGVGRQPLNNKVRALRQQVAMQAAEIAKLEEEKNYWKAEATKAKKTNEGMLKQMFELLNKSQGPGPSTS